MENNIEIHFEISPKAFISAIENSNNLKDDQDFFENLAFLSKTKQEFQERADQIDALDKMVKQAINDKAKALYGADWQAIKGQGFKISRSKTGSVYELTGDEVDEQFIDTKISVKTKAVENYIKDNSGDGAMKLPNGITVNEYRGESIRITIS